jgi:hypothetical protein
MSPATSVSAPASLTMNRSDVPTTSSANTPRNPTVSEHYQRQYAEFQQSTYRRTCAHLATASRCSILPMCVVVGPILSCTPPIDTCVPMGPYIGCLAYLSAIGCLFGADYCAKQANEPEDPLRPRVRTEYVPGTGNEG